MSVALLVLGAICALVGLLVLLSAVAVSNTVLAVLLLLLGIVAAVVGYPGTRTRI